MRTWLGLLLGMLAAVSSHAANPSPQRIVSLNLVSDIILLDLVEPPRIAALSHLASHPHLSIIHQDVVGLRTTRGGAEEVMALQPDLAIGTHWGQGPTLALLQRLGVPIHKIPLAESYAQIAALVQGLAHAVGEPERGRRLLERINATRAKLVAHSQGRTIPDALLFGASGFSGGDSPLTMEIMADAGLRRTASGRVDLERFVLDPPDVLINVVYRPDYPSQTELLLKHPAVRRVHPELRSIPLALLLNATHRTPEASQAIQQTNP